MTTVATQHWVGSAAEELQGRRMLFICPGDPWEPIPAGPEHAAADLAVRLAIRGISITMLAARTPGSRYMDVVGGVVTLRRGRRSFRFLSGLHLLHNRRRYDAVVDFRTDLPTLMPHLLPSATAFACVLTPDAPRRQPWSAMRTLLGRRWYGGRPIIVTSTAHRAEALRIAGGNRPVYVVPEAGVAATTLAGNGRSAELLAAILMDERAMRARGMGARTRRRVVDGATVVIVRGVPFGRIVLHLRHSDVWTIYGDQLTILFQGVDEAGARAAMRRLGVEGRASFRQATDDDFTRQTEVA